MPDPLISTVTPYFRGRRYLEGFLKSVREQTVFDRLEVVLDANEPDECELALLRGFAERHPGRLKLLETNPVAPVSVSMNRCLKEASGEWVAIWNIDDLRTPASLARQADVLARRPEIDFVYGNYTVVRSFGARAGQDVDVSGVSETELTRGMILGPFFMFRKAILERCGYFDEQFKSGADFDLAIRLALHGRGAFVPDCLGYYLDEGKGLSTSGSKLQPVERTVIELRYGIYDKIDYRYVPDACRYNIPYLRQFGEWVPVSRYVPDLEPWLRDRYDQWFWKGIDRFGRRYGPVGRAARSLARMAKRSFERPRQAS